MSDPNAPALFFPGRWAVHDGKDETGRHITLQIELGNDYAVTLTASDEDGARVALWLGSGEQSFIKTNLEHGATVDSFTEWLLEAVDQLVPTPDEAPKRSPRPNQP
jgi:hypothetical protein